MTSNKGFINRLNIGRNKLLLIILGVALLLRLYGINHGLPYGYQVDEKFVINHAMGFGTGDLNPHFFHWPGTTIMYFLFFEYVMLFIGGFVLTIFSSPMDFAELYLLNPTIFYLVGRITMVLIGTGSVYLLYRLGKQMYSRQVGLIGAALFACSPLAVGVDHMIFTDTPLSLLCLLAMILFYRIMTKGGYKTYLLAGLTVGVAVATKYSGAALVAPFAVAHFYRVHEEGKNVLIKYVDSRMLLTGLMVMVGFVLCCPFSVLDFSTFKNDLLWQFTRVNSGSFGMDVDNAYLYYLFTGMPESIGIGLTVICLLGSIVALYGRSKENLLILSFTYFYLFYIGSWAVGVTKYLMPIIPFLLLLGAIFMGEVFSRVKNRPPLKIIMVTLMVLALTETTARSLYSDYLLTQKDTRTQAKEWIEANIPAETKIAVDAGNFDLAKFSPPLDESIESLRAKYEKLDQDFPEVWQNSMDKIKQYLEMKMQHPPEIGYRIRNIVSVMGDEIDQGVNISALKNEGVEYVVVSSYAYEVYGDEAYASQYPEKATFYSEFYASLDQQSKLIKPFYPLSEKRGPGPIIKIYELQN